MLDHAAVNILPSSRSKSIDTLSAENVIGKPQAIKGGKARKARIEHILDHAPTVTNLWWIKKGDFKQVLGHLDGARSLTEAHKSIAAQDELNTRANSFTTRRGRFRKGVQALV